MRVVGIDPGSKNCGVALLELPDMQCNTVDEALEKAVIISAVDIDLKEGDGRKDDPSLLSLREGIESLLDSIRKEDPDLVAIEWSHEYRAGDVLSVTNILTWELEPVVCYAHAWRKVTKTMTGNYRNNKNASVERLLPYFGKLTHNAADAILIAIYAYLL